MKEASRTKADKTPSYDFSKVTVPSSEELANQRKKQRLRRMAGSITPALTGPGIGAGVTVRSGLKAIGGRKGVRKIAGKIKDTATKKFDTRTDAQKYLGLKNKGENVLQTAGRTAKEIPKMLRQQKGNVKRKKTIDAKKEAARKEAARKEAESKRLQLFGGFKRGGVFKGTF